jgi:hypothetical protein
VIFGQSIWRYFGKVAGIGFIEPQILVKVERPKLLIKSDSAYDFLGGCLGDFLGLTGDFF